MKGERQLVAEFADLITDDMEGQGTIEIIIQEQDFFNKDIKEFTVFYKILGESRIKLFRNNRMELVFVRLNDDWMRQAKTDLTGVVGPLTVKLHWDNRSVDELSVKKPGESDFNRVIAVQIDN